MRIPQTRVEDLVSDPKLAYDINVGRKNFSEVRYTFTNPSR